MNGGHLRWSGRVSKHSGNQASRASRGYRLLAPAVAAGLAAIAGSAHATSYSWNGGTGSWGTTSMWTPTGTPGSADTATFNTAANNSNNDVVSLPTSEAIAGITIATTGTTTFQGSSSGQNLSIGASGITFNTGAGVTLIGSGTAAQNVGVVLTASQSWIDNSSSLFQTSNGVYDNSATAYTLTLGGSAGNFNISGGLFNNSTGALSVILNTSAQLTAASNFSGGTTINAGTVYGSVATSFGSGSISLGNASGGSTNVDLRLRSATYANAIKVDSGTTGTLQIDTAGASNPTISGTITGTNNVLITYTTSGIMTVTGTVNNTGIATFSAGSPSTGSLTLTGQLGTNLSAVNVSAGTINFNTSNSSGFFTGLTTVTGGVLTLDRNSTGDLAYSTLGGNIAVNSGAKLVLATDEFGYTNASSRAIAVNGGTFNTGNGAYHNYLGTLNLSGGGTVNIGTGGLAAGGSVATQIFALTTINSTGAGATTNNISGGATGGIDPRGILTVNTARGTASSDLNISAIIQDDTSVKAALVKTGAGVLTLSGANAYSLGTNVSNGTLVIANASASNSATGTGAVSLYNSATLASAAGSSTANVSGTVVVNTGTIAPGGLGTVGTLAIGGLNTSSGSTLNFDLGSGSGQVTNGDVLTVGSNISIGANTAITFNTSTAVAGNDYRLIGGTGASSIYSAAANFTLPTATGYTFSLSNAVDPGYIDLVVGGGSAQSLVWNNGGGGDGLTWDTSQVNFYNGSNYTAFSSANLDNVTFNDANNGNYLVNIPGLITPGSTTVTTSATYNFSGAGGIAGTGGLLVNGSGELYLATANTFVGVTTVASGTLDLANSLALQNSTLTNYAAVLFDSSVSSNTFTIGGLAGPGSIVLNNTTGAGIALTVGGNNNNTTYSGSLSGLGSLTKTGTGTLTLSGSNTYTGPTVINAGVLQFGSPTALPVGNLLAFTGSSTLDFNGNAGAAVSGINISSGVAATLTPGTLTLGTGTVTFLASTAVNSSLSGGTIAISGGATIDASAAGGSSVISGLLESISSQITGTGGLTIKSFGNLTDSGGSNTSFFTLSNTANSFTGGVNITSGLVSVAGGDGIFNNAASASTNAVTLSPGAGLISNGNATLNTASIVLSGTGSHYFRVYGSDTLTLNGVVSGAGGFYKTDGGNVVLTGSNTYTGVTTVQDGSVYVNGVQSGATGGWTIGAYSAYTATVNFSSGSLVNVASANAVKIGTIPGSVAQSFANETLNVATTVNNAGSLSVGRTGYLNVNSGGTWNQSGAMNVEPESGSGYSALVAVNSGGIFNYTGTSAINLTPSITNGGNGQITVTGGTFNTSQGFNDAANIASASTNNSSGSAIVALIGGGTLTLGGNIPALTTTAGSPFYLQLGNASGGVLNTNGYNTAVAATITNYYNTANPGLLTIKGGGTVTLSGASNYSGGTDIIASTAVAGANTALGTGFVLVGATTANSSLQINGPYNIANSITILPTSPYIATVSGTTDSNSALTGAIALAGDGTFTQVASNAGNGLTISGNLSSGNPGVQTATFAGPGIINVTGNLNNSAGTLAVAVTGGITTLSGTNTYSGATNVAAGTLNISNGAALASSTTLNIDAGALVNIVAHNGSSPVVAQVSALNDSGLLDIANNSFIIKGAGAAGLTTVSGLLQTGFNGGSWNGTSGIVSTTAAADPSYLTAVGAILNTDSYGNPIYTSSFKFDNGVIPGASDVILKYTYYGDANLDGAVDGSDYTLIDNGYANGLTGWQNGDFNYDGVIDGSDYTLIDNAFNTQGGTLGVNPAVLVAGTTAQIAGGSAVPEPASIGLIALGALGFMSRRRR